MPRPRVGAVAAGRPRQADAGSFGQLVRAHPADAAEQIPLVQVDLDRAATVEQQLEPVPRDPENGLQIVGARQVGCHSGGRRASTLRHLLRGDVPERAHQRGDLPRFGHDVRVRARNPPRLARVRVKPEFGDLLGAGEGRPQAIPNLGACLDVFLLGGPPRVGGHDGTALHAVPEHVGERLVGLQYGAGRVHNQDRFVNRRQDRPQPPGFH